MAIRPIPATASLAVALSLAFAGPASAATVATLPCVPTFAGQTAPTVPFQGAGFTPGGSVTITYAHPRKATAETAKVVTADAAGAFKDVANPASYTSFRVQDQTFTLVATDNANPANTATTTLRQVRAGFDISPRFSKPTSRVTYTARGWDTAKNVYAHFRFRGKTRRDVKLGRPSGPCGIVSKRMRALPAKPRSGSWTAYVDQEATYSPNTTLQAEYEFTVFLRFVP